MPVLNGRKYPYKHFERGDHVKSLDELVKQDFVFWHKQLLHKGWFLSWQLRMSYMCIGENGCIYYAIKKEEKKCPKN